MEPWGAMWAGSRSSQGRLLGRAPCPHLRRQCPRGLAASWVRVWARADPGSPGPGPAGLSCRCHQLHCPAEAPCRAQHAGGARTTGCFGKGPSKAVDAYNQSANKVISDRLRALLSWRRRGAVPGRAGAREPELERWASGWSLPGGGWDELRTCFNLSKNLERMSRLERLLNSVSGSIQADD